MPGELLGEVVRPSNIEENEIKQGAIQAALGSLRDEIDTTAKLLHFLFEKLRPVTAETPESEGKPTTVEGSCDLVIQINSLKSRVSHISSVIARQADDLQL